MVLWYMALPHLTLADTTAIGFTGPIFIMIGAVVALGERMMWERWVSALIGFAGVLIVVGPQMSASGGYYDLVMLGSSPLFAVSALITKALTRRDRPEVIVVWQCITISLFSLPLALIDWAWPSMMQWLVFLGSGVLGSVGHYCVTRALKAADATASQTVKFLDLIWMTALGFLVFSDVPTVSTLIGGLVIFAATTWIARREARGRRDGLVSG
jgi:drug/metabolite transporter (DMT)-like permease